MKLKELKEILQILRMTVIRAAEKQKETLSDQYIKFFDFRKLNHKYWTEKIY